MPAARSANACIARRACPMAAQQLRQRRLRIAHQAERVRIGLRPSSSGSMSICTTWRVERRNAPGVRHLIAGVAADEQHEVRLVHDLVGRRRGIVARAADRQAMPRRDDAAAAERGADRRGQRLAQRQHFRPGAAMRRRRCPATMTMRFAARSFAAARSISSSDGVGRYGGIVSCSAGSLPTGSLTMPGLDDIRRPSVQVEMRRTRRAASSPRARPGAAAAAGPPRRRHRPRTSSPTRRAADAGVSW